MRQINKKKVPNQDDTRQTVDFAFCVSVISVVLVSRLPFAVIDFESAPFAIQVALDPLFWSPGASDMKRCIFFQDLNPSFRK